MAGPNEQEISLLIQLHGEEAVRRALNGLGQQATQTEKKVDSLGDRLGNLGNRLSSLPGPIGQLGGSIGNLGSSLGALGGIGGFGAVALGAAAAGAAMVALSVNFALAADDASEMADKLGVSTERLAALKIVADENSGSVEAYVKVQDKLAKSMAKLDEGSDKTERHLANLGLSMDDLKGKSPDAQLALLVEAFEATGRSQKGVAAMTALVSGGFRDVIPMIKAGEAAIKEAAEMNKYYGVTTDNELIGKGGEAERAMTRLKLSIKGLAQETSTGFSDPFVDFAIGASEAFRYVNELLKKYKELKHVAAGVVGGAGGALAGAAVGGVAGGVLGSVIPGAGTVAGAAIGAKLGAGVGTYLGARGAMSANQKRQEAKDNPWLAGMDQAPKQDDLNYKADQKKNEADQKEQNRRLDAEAAAEKAREKAKAAAEAAAKAAEANAKRIQELGRQTLVDDERKIMLARGANAEQMAVFETTKGNLREISQAQKDAHIASERDLETTKKKAEIEKDIIASIEKRSQMMSTIADKGISQIEQETEALRNKMSLDDRTKGLSKNEKEAFKEREDKALAFSKTRRELTNNLKGKLSDDPKVNAKLQDEYAAAIARVAEAEAAYGAVSSERMTNLKAEQGDWWAGATEAFDRYTEGLTNMKDEIGKIGDNLFKGMEDALTQFVMTGKLSFTDLAKSIIADLAKIAAKKAAVGLFEMFMGGGKSVDLSGATFAAPSVSLNAMPGFANGGAFNKGTQFFANGGVVNRATGFGMANGGQGVMGEAGPEAIMPLKRGANGQLGVQVSGGGGGTTLHIAPGAIVIQGTNNPEENAIAVEKRLISIAKNQALKAIHEQSTRNGGMLYGR